MGILSTLLASFSSAATVEHQVGDTAPAVSAKNEEGNIVDVEYGEGFTMVYFYPKADTPGCTAQACSLRDAYNDLVDKGVKVYGVSADSPKAQLKFKQKYRLPFTLLADTDQKVAKAFGVPVRMGFASRQAFLIKNGKFIWIDRTASTKKQAEDILRVIEK